MSEKTKKEKLEEAGAIRVVCGFGVFLSGFYEHSILIDRSIINRASDAFYICSSWGMWIAGPLLFAYGIYTLLQSERP